uniref:HORMA domain-containing protein n=1 Tax=Haptolina brevifila TaxID=156173 RepID=A0A7S2IC33_9EUKA|mmetsp:Transcript_64476/g.127347  ORF Transcript_64476/g.127347 Transcript_64476/m.127347 type:complete len:204 (+) Transcript_64476:38-649(+)
MPPAATAATTGLSLKGSVKTVTEFFKYSVNNILYQREIYPSETFKAEKAYGLSLFVTTEPGLAGYLANVLTQIETWLKTGNLQKLVLVITSQTTGETLERWVFDLTTDKSIGENDKVDKSEKEVTQEIAAIQRQITASVTFLPLNDEPCAFDLLVYTDDDIQVPKAWEESDPRLIVNSDEVKLRSFTTKIHKVDAQVSYKADS